MGSIRDSPPPGDTTPDSWHPDPLGSGRERKWDGAKWTQTVRTPRKGTGHASVTRQPGNMSASALPETVMPQGAVGTIGKKSLEEIVDSCRAGEKPEFIIGSGMAGSLAAFSDRCMIVKKGGLTSWMAGATGGGRSATFHYVDIVSIEYNSGWNTGTLEILTPSHDAGRASDYWKTSGTSGRGSSAWEMPNVLPLSKSEYSAARHLVDRLRELVAESKRPQPSNPTPAPANDIASQLAQLSELHASGALDDDEFRAAKARILEG